MIWLWRWKWIFLTSFKMKTITVHFCFSEKYFYSIHLWHLWLFHHTSILLTTQWIFNDNNSSNATSHSQHIQLNFNRIQNLLFIRWTKKQNFNFWPIFSLQNFFVTSTTVFSVLSIVWCLRSRNRKCDVKPMK